VHYRSFSVLLLAGSVVLSQGLRLSAHEHHSHAAHEDSLEHAHAEEMRQATSAFLESLDENLREKATFPFDGDERTDWHFIPKERVGVNWHDMNLDQRRAAHVLLRTALSSQGYLKAATIMSLETELRRTESQRPNVERIRDPEKYWFAVFGDPTTEEPWGWKIEGHHLSLNFSSATGRMVAVTPAFFGANPAEIRQGPRAGLRVLGGEEDLARQLIQSCSDEQRAEAIIADESPGEVIAVPGKEIKFGEPAGLAAGEMNDEQQELLRRLVKELVNNFSQDLSRKFWSEIREAGFEKIHFAWAGSLEPGKGHYFRIHGPTLAIEYDNTQNDANHIHIVWHSPENNFGRDTLRRHYEESPHH